MNQPFSPLGERFLLQGGLNLTHITVLTTTNYSMKCYHLIQVKTLRWDGPGMPLWHNIYVVAYVVEGGHIRLLCCPPDLM